MIHTPHTLTNTAGSHPLCDIHDMCVSAHTLSAKSFYQNKKKNCPKNK